MTRLLVLLVVTLTATVLTTGRAAAAPLPVSLSGAGASWDSLELNGPLLGWNDASSSGLGGGGDHFDDALGLRIGGAAYGAPSGNVTVAGNTITGETQSLAGLNVTVQYQASTAYPVMRQIAVLSNPTGSSITTTAQWINNAGSDSSTVVIGSSSGDLLFGTNDSWVVIADSTNTAATDTESTVYVLYGPGSPGVTTSSVALTEGEASFGGAGSEGVVGNYDFTIGAGETKYLMWFVGLGGTGNQALSLASQFNDPNSATFQALTSDLSASQLANILNYAVAPQVGAPVPEPATLAVFAGVVGVGGLVARRRKHARD